MSSCCFQVEGQVTESRWSADQLPSIVRHIRELMQASTNRIAIAASPGCQEYAAAVAVAHAVQNEGLAPYAALVQLQHAHHQLKVSKPKFAHEALLFVTSQGTFAELPCSMCKLTLSYCSGMYALPCTTHLSLY